MLLLLSHFGKDSKTETVVAGINQEHLAQMVGTTRSRINHFMNKFRKLGFIDYNSEVGLDGPSRPSKRHRARLGSVVRTFRSAVSGRPEGLHYIGAPGPTHWSAPTATNSAMHS